jgi:hypothetical protein
MHEYDIRVCLIVHYADDLFGVFLYKKESFYER